MKSLFLRAMSLVALGLLAHSPASAYEVYLDHNTDGLISTFNNVVEGPTSAPIDIVVEIGPGDLTLSFVQASISWGYGGVNGGSQGCFEVFGSVQYVQYQPLPDSGPFTNILPFTCVCRGGARCFCESTMLIQADVVGLTLPGLYRLATLTFSRVGFASDCSYPTYSVAQFSTGAPAPEGTLTIQAEGATSVSEGLQARSWGLVKSTYR